MKKAPPPSSLADVLQRLDAWLGQHRKRYHAALHPGSAAAALPALPLPWPDELQTLLAWHDGQGDDFVGRFAEDWELMRGQAIVAAKRDLDADAATTGWQPAWIPFLDDDAGDYVCLDTAKAGVPVREFWLGNTEHPVVAPSLTAWLRTFVQDLERGRYTEDPERGTMMRENNS